MWYVGPAAEGKGWLLMQFLGISAPSTNSAADEIIPVTPSSKTLSTHSVQHLNIKNSNMQTYALHFVLFDL